MFKNGSNESKGIFLGTCTNFSSRSGVRTPATPLQKIPLLYPEPLEVPIRGRVQLRIVELGDEAGEKQKKKSETIFFKKSTIPTNS